MVTYFFCRPSSIRRARGKYLPPPQAMKGFYCFSSCRHYFFHKFKKFPNPPSTGDVRSGIIPSLSFGDIIPEEQPAQRAVVDVFLATVDRDYFE